MSQYNKEIDFILQNDFIKEFLPSIGKSIWQTIYYSTESDNSCFGISCALLSSELAKESLESDNWDILYDEGSPGFSIYRNNTTYHRFGGLKDGIFPLVIGRQFYGSYPNYVELSEEFRHYHDLAEDYSNGLLLDFDASGLPIEVARINPNKVEVQLRYLKQFQAGTQLYLGVYFDSLRYSMLDVDQLSKSEKNINYLDDQTRYFRIIGKNEPWQKKYKSFSRFYGKVLLPPGDQKNAGIWPFEDSGRDKEVEFIIGVDENGNPIYHTSHPNKLSSNFDPSPSIPHYLTPVYFRRDVLNKYYTDSDRYVISDGRLSCLGLWSCQIDLDHIAHVVAFLGDLGRDLPFNERLHWKQYNVNPEGGVSKNTFLRSFLNQWTSPESVDMVFRSEYNRLNQSWHKSQGWSLFRKLNEDEKYLIKTIRIPITNSQEEFDLQVLTLSKLLVDYLNEKEIKSRITNLTNGDKGIDKFEKFLHSTGFQYVDSIIPHLRNLQQLRSSGSAHAKGSRYYKLANKIGINTSSKAEAMKMLLEKSITSLNSLGLHYCDEYNPIKD